MPKTPEYCSECKFRKSNGTCKESPKEPVYDYDWCSAFKRK